MNQFLTFSYSKIPLALVLVNFNTAASVYENTACFNYRTSFQIFSYSTIINESVSSMFIQLDIMNHNSGS